MAKPCHINNHQRLCVVASEVLQFVVFLMCNRVAQCGYVANSTEQLTPNFLEVRVESP